MAGRERALNLLVGLLATLVGFGVLEAGFRFKAWLDDRGTLERAVERRPPARPDGQVGLGDLVRLSPDADIVYELVPNARGVLAGGMVIVNGEGFRGRVYPQAKPPGTVRIVGLGDSVMFGWGVADGEDYLSQLEARLTHAYPDRRWEAVNLAVPGYNGVMEVETLRVKGLRYAPDLVVLGFCGNDMGLPEFLRDEEDYFTPRRSFLAEFLTDRLARAAPPDDSGLMPRPHLGRRPRDSWDGFAEEPGAVPPRYRHMVGLSAYGRAMDALAEMSRAHGFEVLVLFYPRAPKRVLPLVAGHGFHLVDMGPSVDRYSTEHGIQEYRGSALTVSAGDPHPSRIGHALIADSLLEGFKAQGLAESLRDRTGTGR